MPRAKKEDGEVKECLMFQKQCLALQLQSTCGISASRSGTSRNSGSHTALCCPLRGWTIFQSTKLLGYHLGALKRHKCLGANLEQPSKQKKKKKKLCVYTLGVCVYTYMYVGIHECTDTCAHVHICSCYMSKQTSSGKFIGQPRLRATVLSCDRCRD